MRNFKLSSFKARLQLVEAPSSLNGAFITCPNWFYDQFITSSLILTANVLTNACMKLSFNLLFTHVSIIRQWHVCPVLFCLGDPYSFLQKGKVKLTLAKENSVQRAQQHDTETHWMNADPTETLTKYRVSERFELWPMLVILQDAWTRRCAPLTTTAWVLQCDGVQWVAVAAWLGEEASNYGTLRGGLGPQTPTYCC